MSVSLRPVLRPSTLPSVQSSSSKSTTYICQACRHARLLRRPKRPYTFSQLITLSDGSAFMTRTTSPQPVYRSTRDTRNALLWNPSSKELMNVEDDEAGRLAGFRARFGTMFDIVRESEEQDQPEPQPVPGKDAEGASAELEGAQVQATPDSKSGRKPSRAKQEDELQYEFEEDDANLLDLISSYGQPEQSSTTPPAAAPKPEKGKPGKK